MIIELTDRAARALYNLIALGRIDVDRELKHIEEALEDFIVSQNRNRYFQKPNQFPALGHEALCEGWTKLARAESADGN